MNKSFLKDVAAEAGCSPAAAAAIDRLTLARELWKGLPEADAKRFFSVILARCQAACGAVYPAASLTILLLDEEGNVFEN